MYKYMIEGVKKEIRGIEAGLNSGYCSEFTKKILTRKLFTFKCLLRELTQGDIK